MIRQATDADFTQLKPRLSADGSRALFILGDIKAFGLQTSFQTTWVDHDESGYHAILLRYYENLIWYIFDEVKDLQGFEALLTHPSVNTTGCTLSHYQKLPKRLQHLIHPRFTFLCECPTLAQGTYTARAAKPDDAEAIIYSMDQIDEFKVNPQLERSLRIQRYRSDLLAERTYAHVLFDASTVIAAASSTAHSENGAMVVGVFTLPAYRQQGHASGVVGSLVQTLHRHNLIPVLFYDNPKAGQLYHDLGFNTIDQWVMGKVKR